MRQEAAMDIVHPRVAGIGAGEIHLDLADVQHCDLAGLRAMIRLAHAGRRGDSRQVVLHEVPPRLQTVLGILGWDSTPGWS